MVLFQAIEVTPIINVSNLSGTTSRRRGVYSTYMYIESCMVWVCKKVEQTKVCFMNFSLVNQNFILEFDGE